MDLLGEIDLNIFTEILNQNKNLGRDILAKLCFFDKNGVFTASSDADFFSTNSQISLVDINGDKLSFPCDKKQNAYIYIADSRYSASVTPLSDGGACATVFDDECMLSILSNGSISENITSVIKSLRDNIMAINTGLDAVGFMLEDKELYDEMELLSSPVDSCISILGSMNALSELGYYAKGEISAIALDISDILSNLTADMPRKLGKKDIRLTTKIDNGAVVKLNANRFIAMLMTLLYKAVLRLKTISERTIDIKLAKSADNVILTISAPDALTKDNAPLKKPDDISDMVIKSFCQSYNAVILESDVEGSYNITLRLKAADEKALQAFRSSYVDSKFSVYNTYMHKILSEI